MITWINAEYSSKYKFNGWHPYITTLCNGETMDDAIVRIESENPQFNFRNFQLGTKI